MWPFKKKEFTADDARKAVYSAKIYQKCLWEIEIKSIIQKIKNAAYDGNTSIGINTLLHQDISFDYLQNALTPLGYKVEQFNYREISISWSKNDSAP